MSNQNNNTSGLIIMVLYLVAAILPAYAAYQDYQMDKELLALFDILAFPLGIARGLMYLLGL